MKRGDKIYVTGYGNKSGSVVFLKPSLAIVQDYAYGSGYVHAFLIKGFSEYTFQGNANSVKPPEFNASTNRMIIFEKDEVIENIFELMKYKVKNYG